MIHHTVSVINKCDELHNVSSVVGNISSFEVGSITTCEDQKIFLNASQVLERLNTMIKKRTKYEDNKSKYSFSEYSLEKASCDNFSDLTLKKLIIYRNKLRHLLIQRCVLVLKEECIHCIQECRTLYEECKINIAGEKAKLNIPLKTYNRFIDNSYINMSNSLLFLKKLNYAVEQWQLAVNNFLRIVNIFHSEYNIYLLLCKILKVVINLKQQCLYWIYKGFLSRIRKLCVFDSDSVSSESIQHVFGICEYFNKFISKKKSLIFTKFAGHVLGFDNKYCIRNLSCKVIFIHLSSFEANVAAERIMNFILSDSLKESKMNFKGEYMLSLLSNTFSRSESLKDMSTSGYSSYSLNDIQESSLSSKTVKGKKTANSSINLTSIFSSILQKNQALVLKYVFAIKCIESYPSNHLLNDEKSEEKGKSNSARKVWKLEFQRYNDESCSYLERIYWKNFWLKVQYFILKSLFEIPCHQHGNILYGTVALWSVSFTSTVLKVISESCANDDICEEGKTLMKQLVIQMYYVMMLMLWDKRLCMTLPVLESHRCIAVPIMNDRMQTEAGNFLCVSFEPLVSFFTIPHLHFLLPDKFKFCVTTMQKLLSTLDIFLHWVTVKQRALISSLNISLFLLIGCSDTMAAYKLLKILNQEVCSKYFDKCSFFCSTYFLDNLLTQVLQKISVLKNIMEEIPTVTYKHVYLLVLRSLSLNDTNQRCWRCSSKTDITEDVLSEIMNNILSPAHEIVKSLPSHRKVVVSAINAVTCGYLNFFQNENISTHEISLLIKDLSNLNEWVENLSVNEVSEYSYGTSDCIQKLIHVTNLLSAKNNTRWTFSIRRNRVQPQPT